MFKRLTHVFWILLFAAMLVAQPFTAQTASAELGPQGNLFVKQAGPELRLNGKLYRFAGSNNYYPIYKSQFMVDDLLTTAQASGFRVMRLWGSLDIGNQDGSNSVGGGPKEGVYFQYWDGTAPAYNDGENGLQRLDYVLYKAGQLGIRVVIPFVNNWNDFGGMDQYVRWAGGQYHDQFYTDPQIRQWYKNWIAHLLDHTNTYTGVQYKNDPTIMTWELANEPRCLSAGVYERSPDCTTQTLITWADEMSTFIKTIDTNHLVSVGDEGFYCTPGAADWTENCGEGVDTLAFTRLANIDVMSFHLYPDHWGKDAAWGTQWIKRHFADARKLSKPAVLGEFGWQDKSTRNPVFKEWTDTVFKSGGAGALYWILSGKQDGGGQYPDYDSFTVYCPSPVCTTFSNFSAMMTANKALVYPPVADDRSAITEFETPVTLNLVTSAIAYGGATIVPGSVDLDPAAAGQQISVTVYGGTYVAQADGRVTFTPAAGFSGKSQVAYTVKDSAGRLSNLATILITVKPNPTGALLLYAFETGAEGWASAGWNAAGSVAQSTDWATDGTHSLMVLSNGGWFTSSPSPALNLTGKSVFKFDLQTLGVGTSGKISLQVGPNWDWCENAFSWVGENTVAAVEVDLTTMSCGTPNLGEVHGVFIYLNAGTFYIDNIRVQ